ncbi:hypothetical protein [Conexibacter woesei]|uniref:Uncharacterized protein n=1 Tax=Conexibacter woesei (strain DSM 14684 / CCUG 47730 / CIP 108061 / JCM 11494 / NBRC 100937 / ID131577) TaxID=469383 RepID=D3F832_CONWI|nr:hypothetical protein [Conexibacter woesei]ADB52926.1 conserved hypothetical protein [Conexibacter woesei DSM 14684]
MTEVGEIVRAAIVNRQQLVATYGGHVRELCPHAIGTKRGRAQALFFQFGGSSGRGLAPGGDWRCLPLSGLSGVAPRDGDWHTGPGAAQRQTCLDVVELAVEEAGQPPARTAS